MEGTFENCWSVSLETVVNSEWLVMVLLVCLQILERKGFDTRLCSLFRCYSKYITLRNSRIAYLDIDYGSLNPNKMHYARTGFHMGLAGSLQ